MCRALVLFGCQASTMATRVRLQEGYPTASAVIDEFSTTVASTAPRSSSSSSPEVSTTWHWDSPNLSSSCSSISLKIPGIGTTDLRTMP